MKNDQLLPSLTHVLTAFVLASVALPSFAQEEIQKETGADGEILSEQTLYQIEELRLERWLSDNYLIFADQALLTEVAGLKKESEALADSGDYEMANVWLETIWSLLTPGATIADGIPGQQVDDSAGAPMETAYPEERRSAWNAELLTGIDLSRYGFDLAYFEADSFITERISEREGNPYTGLRIEWEYDGPGKQSFLTQASYRQGLDHVSGDASLKLHQPLTRGITLKLQDRLDGTSFFGEDNLRYFQNRLRTQIDSRFGPLTLELQDDFLIRRNIGESAINYDYSHNGVLAGLRYQTGVASYAGGGYRFVSRRYPSLELNDYNEHRAECDLMQSFGAGHHLWVDADVRWRRYAGTPMETSQYHLGFNVMGEIRVILNRFSEIHLLGLTSRTNYELFSEASLTDLFYWEWEPQLFLKPGTPWRLGFGAVFGGETYEGAFDDVNDYSIQDYTSIGPSIEIEFLSVNNIMFTLKETYRFKRYRNGVSNVAELNSYSDRNVNSVSLFFSWSIDRHWRINAIASIADERLRHSDAGDFTNTVAGVEVSYGF